MAELGNILESYDQKPVFYENPDRSAMRQSDRAASINDVTTYIYQSLLDYQGKWTPSDRTIWIVKFQNARYLNVGDTIWNATQQFEYTIAEVVDESEKMVRLTGTAAPTAGDIMRLHENNIVNFVSDYPQEYRDKAVNAWVDTVSFRVVRVEPGSIGTHPFDPPTEIKPRTRQYIVDPDYPDCHVAIMGQWFDNLIQFDCWSKTNNRADELIEWFADFMYKYIWVWKKNGVNEILYWMRAQDEEVRKWRDDLQVRSVTYYFRTEKIVTLREHDLKQLDIYLEVSNVWPSGMYGVGYTTLPPSGKNEVIDQGFELFIQN